MTTLEQQRKHKIYHVTIVGSVVNLLLSVGKLLAGVFGHSGAMIADAIHSASDFATDVVVLLFVNVSSKPKDADHDYGHGKYETLATIIIGLALAAVGIGILINSVELISRVVAGEVIERPGVIALVAAFVSIVAKEALYWYTVKVGRDVKSSSVVANAWHHRSDALSSVGTLLGIGLAFFLGDKWRIADPIAAIVVSALILKVAYDLAKVGIDELLEKSLPEDVEAKILEIVTNNPEVTLPHNLRTRRIGNNIAIEVHVRVDGAMTVDHSHALTIDIEHRLRDEFGGGTMVAIHVEPLHSSH